MTARSNDSDASGDVDRGAGKAPISVRESSGHLVANRKGPPPAPTRRFALEETEWIARLAGEGYGGTGALAPGYLAAIRFCRADSPDEPVSELLVPRGRFESLYDEELRELLARAEPLDRDDEHP